MEPTSYLGKVHTALSARDFAVSSAEVAGRRAIAGRRADFRWRWFAVRLHTAVIVASFSAEEAQPELLDRFLDAASRWAVHYGRGRAHGMQSATAAIAVAVVAGNAGAARDWAGKPHGRRYAEVAYPVAVDLSAATVVQPQRMIVGGIFVPYLRGIVHDVIEVPLLAP